MLSAENSPNYNVVGRLKIKQWKDIFYIPIKRKVE
jgi:hypothetical protein